MELLNLTTLAKTSVDNYHYLQLSNSTSRIDTKISMASLFPSMATTGSSSESLWISVTNKNQLNFKGLQSADVTKMTVTTGSNNLILTLLEAGIDLNTCNNANAGFLKSIDFTNAVVGQNSVINGGTGLSTIPKGAVLYASANDTLAATAAPINGQVLIGNASTGIPAWNTLTAGTNITTTETAGVITLAAGLATLTADLDCATHDINLNTAAGASWISGNGNKEGVTVDANGKVFIGEDTPTVAFDDSLNIEGGIRFTNTAAPTIKPTATTGSNVGMAVTIESGSSVSGAAGNLNLTGGTSSTAGAGGSVIITGGQDTGSTNNGTIQLKTYTGGSAVAAVTVGSEGQDVTVNTGDVIMSTGNVYMRNSSNPDVIKYQGTQATTDDGTAVISAANILTGIVQCTPTADRSKATDTSANLISGLSLLVNGDSFDFSVISLATNGTSHITITGGTDVVLVGCMVVSAQDLAEDAFTSGVGRFRVTRTSGTVATIFRIG
jgi:hypothetical protein|tara:strand:+ start:8775 stop:10262 length:1488 start_codon:yes stop_codon:yes gene_type:complete